MNKTAIEIRALQEKERKSIVMLARQFGKSAGIEYFQEFSKRRAKEKEVEANG